jgi:hypothetical protein
VWVFLKEKKKINIDAFKDSSLVLMIWFFFLIELERRGGNNKVLQDHKNFPMGCKLSHPNPSQSN